MSRKREASTTVERPRFPGRGGDPFAPASESAATRERREHAEVVAAVADALAAGMEADTTAKVAAALKAAKAPSRRKAA